MVCGQRYQRHAFFQLSIEHVSLNSTYHTSNQRASMKQKKSESTFQESHNAEMHCHINPQRLSGSLISDPSIHSVLHPFIFVRNMFKRRSFLIWMVLLGSVDTSVRRFAELAEPQILRTKWREGSASRISAFLFETNNDNTLKANPI